MIAPALHCADCRLGSSAIQTLVAGHVHGLRRHSEGGTRLCNDVEDAQEDVLSSRQEITPILDLDVSAGSSGCSCAGAGVPRSVPESAQTTKTEMARKLIPLRP